jgi:hypothetical protein
VLTGALWEAGTAAFAAVGFDPGKVVLGPIANSVDREDEGPPKRGEGVLNHGGDDGVNLAEEDAIVLEGADGLGEHLLGDAGDLALEFVVTEGAACQTADDEGGPFITYAREDDAGRATGIEDAGSCWHLG